ncbi:MAG: hypothetical protein WD605_03055 [Candidatus Paceibacterota bacterium]
MVNVSEKNLEELFHLSDMSDDEKLIFLSDIGGLILESSVLRFLTESDEDTADHFSHMVDAYADKEDLPVILTESFPLFGAILEEEAEAFREEATRVLGSK